MSEREPQYEAPKSSELDKKNLEKLSEDNYERMRQAAEKAEAKTDSIEAIQERIEKTALSKEDIESNTTETAASESSLRGASAQLKGAAFRQRMKEIQRKETPAQRTFSKFIHQPAVESVSNAAEGTIARPSGLLFGGLFSVVSSIAILYICKHYGYEYNFLIGLVFFVGGFFLGLIIEGIWRIFRRKSK